MREKRIMNICPCRFLFGVLIVLTLQLTGIPLREVSAQSYATFDVTEFGAIPNDSIDDTKSITAVINSAIKNGGGLVYFPAGTYIISGTLMIKNATNVIISGEGTIKQSTIGKDIINIVNSQGIVVSGISLQGWQDGTKNEFDTNGSLAIGSGIRVEDNSDNITINDCKIFNQNINGVSIVETPNVVINNCEISNTRTSIRLHNATGVAIIDNYMRNQKADGVYVLGTFKDILIDSNTIKGFGDTAIDVTGYGSNIRLWWNDISDSTNTSADPNGLGISISKTITGFQAISNKIGNVAAGMSLDASSGTISNNQVSYRGISADWTKLRVQDRYVVDLGSYKSFEQFGISIGGSDLKVRGNSITSPAHIMKPMGWDLDKNKIRNYGIKIFGSNNAISSNSLLLYTDKDPIGYSETSNVLNYGIKIGGSASGVTVDSNGLHVMTAASYNSVIEKSSSNTLCVQLNNNIIVDGEAIDLIKGF